MGKFLFLFIAIGLIIAAPARAELQGKTVLRCYMEPEHATGFRFEFADKKTKVDLVRILLNQLQAEDELTQSPDYVLYVHAITDLDSAGKTAGKGGEGHRNLGRVAVQQYDSGIAIHYSPARDENWRGTRPFLITADTGGEARLTFAPFKNQGPTHRIAKPLDCYPGAQIQEPKPINVDDLSETELRLAIDSYATQWRHEYSLKKVITAHQHEQIVARSKMAVSRKHKKTCDNPGRTSYSYSESRDHFGNVIGYKIRFTCNGATYITERPASRGVYRTEWYQGVELYFDSELKPVGDTVNNPKAYLKKKTTAYIANPKEN